MTGDVAADLRAIARHPVVTTCAGAKAFLDLPLTVEVLDTLGGERRRTERTQPPGAG